MPMACVSFFNLLLFVVVQVTVLLSQHLHLIFGKSPLLLLNSPAGGVIFETFCCCRCFLLQAVIVQHSPPRLPAQEFPKRLSNQNQQLPPFPHSHLPAALPRATSPASLCSTPTSVTSTTTSSTSSTSAPPPWSPSRWVGGLEFRLCATHPIMFH